MRVFSTTIVVLTTHDGAEVPTWGILMLLTVSIYTFIMSTRHYHVYATSVKKRIAKVLMMVSVRKLMLEKSKHFPIIVKKYLFVSYHCWNHMLGMSLVFSFIFYPNIPWWCRGTDLRTPFQVPIFFILMLLTVFFYCYHVYTT